MANLDLYNRLRAVPPTAQKPIGAGRLKGMTDINPMWRIKKITEVFGECGTGWWTQNVKFWIEPCEGGEVLAFCTLELVVKDRQPSFGIGGSKMVAVESKGKYADDECFKKAYTDALSVACKAFGMGADIYFPRDAGQEADAPFEGSKYVDEERDPPKPKDDKVTESELKAALAIKVKVGEDSVTIDKLFKEHKDKLKEAFDNGDDVIKLAINTVQRYIKQQK